METLLRIQQGDTWALQIVWTNDDGSPVDMTGATAKMQLRTSVTSSTVVLELSSENGRITIGQAGRLDLQIAADDTAAMPTASGVYDLEVKFASGVVKKIIRGSYLVTPEVTR